MNIEQTRRGDLIVSFQDVKTKADRAFAHKVLARWLAAPIMLKAAGGLVKVLSERKFRGEGAAGIRAMIAEIETLIADVGVEMDPLDRMATEVAHILVSDSMAHPDESPDQRHERLTGQYDTDIPAEDMPGDTVRFGRPDELTQAEMAEIDAADQGKQSA